MAYCLPKVVWKDAHKERLGKERLRPSCLNIYCYFLEHFNWDAERVFKSFNDYKRIAAETGFNLTHVADCKNQLLRFGWIKEENGEIFLLKGTDELKENAARIRAARAARKKKNNS